MGLFLLEIFIQRNNYNGNLIENNGNDEDKDENLLEMAYLIIQHDNRDINNCLKLKIMEIAKNYYIVNRRHSGILLGMLKRYDDFGNILFEIEQE